MNFDNKKYRINFQIKSHSVRVSHNSNQLGVLSTDKARQYAQSYGLDLIEVVPNASPPVCIIDDFGKFRYENKIKEKENKKKQGRRREIKKKKEERVTVHGDGVNRIGRMEGRRRRRRWKREKKMGDTLGAQTASSYEPTQENK